MKTKFIIFIFFLLTGCFGDKFRYTCQDPKNWEIDECKPPICTASQTCPEFFNKPQNEAPKKP